MRDFDIQLARLKSTLNVSEDQQVAQALGLSKYALADRKRRGSFPVKKLMELKIRRPELGLDDTYILTGVQKSDPERPNIELAEKISREADGDVEGPFSQQLYEGLGKRHDPSGVMDVAREQILGRGFRPLSPKNDAKLAALLDSIAQEVDWKDPESMRKLKSRLMKEILNMLVDRSLDDMELIHSLIERLPPEQVSVDKNSRSGKGEKA